MPLLYAKSFGVLTKQRTRPYTPRLGTCLRGKADDQDATWWDLFIFDYSKKTPCASACNTTNRYSSVLSTDLEMGSHAAVEKQPRIISLTMVVAWVGDS